MHPKCVPCVYQDGIPDDLAEVVAVWADLSVEMKAEILAKVRKE